MHCTRKVRSFVAVFVLLASGRARAADWTQQFGPNRNNVVPADVAGPLADHFDSEKLKVMWQANVGFGLAPVVVQCGRVYTVGFYNTGTTAGSMSDPRSAPTDDYVRNVTFWGKPPEAIFESKNLPGTPSWNRENHRSLRGEDWVQCLDEATGKQLWASKLSDYGLVYKDHQSFALASPLISEGKLYIHANTGHLVLLERRRWEDRLGY